MNHRTARSFWTAYRASLANIRKLADRSFALLEDNPRHPSLRLKPVGNYWSVRIGIGYRAPAVRRDDIFVWFWIGSHADYDRLIG